MVQTVLERSVRPDPPVQQRRLQGIIPITGRQLAFQRRVTVLMTVVPVVAVGWALAAMWGRGIHANDFWVMLSFYVFTVTGISVGFHRLFTHKAFRVVRPIRWLLAVAGSMAVEGSVISWVAGHRRHHAYADQPGDPHSPHLVEADGLKGSLLGLWHAHMGWLFDPEKTDHDRWAPDLVKDPVIARVDRQFPFLVILSFTLPAVIGALVGGSFHSMWTMFVWAGLVRIFLIHHMTWSINSICHFYGRRPYETKEQSRNVWSLSLISFGESWHNNHHRFPSSAFLGLEWWQIDFGGYVIRGLRRLGLARDVKEPSREQRLARYI